jgi:thiamine-phosphate pyrophosphorylase
MPARPLLYYITDRAAFPGDEQAGRHALLDKIAEAASAGVDYIQLREKDLPARDLESLATDALKQIRHPQLATGNRQPATAFPGTVLVINSRTDVAIAAGADGVHLSSQEISPMEVCRIWDAARVWGAGRLPHVPARVVISVSCHQPAHVHQAQIAGADLALFAPVFEKKAAPSAQPAGIAALRLACRHQIPVLALGGVTLENAADCLAAGAAGIAAIRLFQENEIADVVRSLHGL